MSDVFLLFLIPIGGGIPGGVSLGHARGLGWPTLMLLYLASDVVLALAFEPLLLAFKQLARRSPYLTRVIHAYRAHTLRLAARYGQKPGWFKLVLIAFGVDPMTGRAAALAAGHGFLSGWLIAIAGDMIFFTVIMISTLWLGSVLGDGTYAALIVLLVMLLAPALIERLRMTQQT